MKTYYRNKAATYWLASILFFFFWLASLVSCVLLVHVTLWCIPIGIASAIAWYGMREAWGLYQIYRIRCGR